MAGVHRRDRGLPGGERRATRAAWNRDRRRSPGRRAAADPGRAGRRPDPRRGDIRLVRGSARLCSQPDPRVRALADPSGHVVRERARSASASSSASSRSALIVTLVSTGLATLLAGIGVAAHRDGDRRLAARRPDRALASVPRRARSRLLPHPYRPLRGGIRRDPARRVRRREPLAGRALRRDQPAAGGHRVRGRRASSGPAPCRS